MQMSTGTMGALIGLGCGLAEYILVVRMMARVMGGQKDDVADGAHEALERRVVKMKWALMCGAFVILPAVGFAVGQAYRT